NMGFLMIVQNMYAKQELPNLTKYAGTRKVKAVQKDGRGQRISFHSANAHGGDNHEAAIVRLFASESYYRGLLNEPQRTLEGATLDHLLNAWIAVTQIGA